MQLFKLVQMLCLLTVTAPLAFAQEDQARQEPNPGKISMRFKLKWDALWAQDATLEEVSQEDRSEYIQEALQEISSKMKRKHKQRSLAKFTVLEQVEENVHVEYPELKTVEGDSLDWSDDQLKDLAMQILTTNVVNTVNVLRDGVEVDIFQLEEYQKRADENWEKRKAERPIDEYEMRLAKEREKKFAKQTAEFNEALEEQKKQEESMARAKIAAADLMQKQYQEMNDKLLAINQMIADLQAQAEKNKTQRQEYEEANGITDGDERLQNAMEEARQRHAERSKQLSGSPDAKMPIAEQSEDDESPSEAEEATETIEITQSTKAAESSTTEQVDTPANDEL